MRSLVCVPIAVQDVDAALVDARAARDGGADLVEWRVDQLAADEGEIDAQAVRRLVNEAPLPCIVTVRTVREGGQFAGPVAEIAEVIDAACGWKAEGEGGEGGGMVAPARYVDVELGAYEASGEVRAAVGRLAHQGEGAATTSIIISMHDFGGRPVDLMRRLAKAAQVPGAAVVKVAYRARSLRDCLELLELPAALGMPVIALGMGEFGVMSRVLANKCGGFLTFASLRAARLTAPGQPLLADLLGMYHIRETNAATRVYGIVGWPVEHSLSPRVHNAGFVAGGHNAIYVPLPIAAGDGGDGETSYLSFKVTLLEMIEHARLELCGCSITIPHKEHALRLAREAEWEVDAAAAAIGAGNTLAITRGEKGLRVRLSNTDAPALAMVLERAMKAEVIGSSPLAGRTVAVLGAGGVARAAVWACAQRGATVVIYARQEEKAKALAAEMQGKLGGERMSESMQGEKTQVGKIVGAAWELLPKACCDALVNCTPVGMQGGPAPEAIVAPVAEMDQCAADLVVMDTVYRPAMTPLLREAQRLGMRTVDGVGMFIEQAKLQFAQWTGEIPPEGVFERAVGSE